MILTLIFLSLAHAAPRTAARPAAVRTYIPDDADPCDFERFKADPALAQWIRQISPNTATSARCYHSAAKMLPVASALFAELDKGTLSPRDGAKMDLRAACLVGYQLDSVIEVQKDGKRHLGLVFRSGVNGPATAQVYVSR